MSSVDLILLRSVFLVQGRPSGVLIVTDTTPEEPVEYVKVNKPSMNSSAGNHPLVSLTFLPHFSHVLSHRNNQLSLAHHSLSVC